MMFTQQNVKVRKMGDKTLEDADYEFWTQDRIQKIQQIIGQYGEDKFAISFSGGKDSTVLSALVDMALPNNTIPRIYANTGIELNMIREFVEKKVAQDNRFIMLKPSAPIKQTLDQYGYPFKSKMHSKTVDRYQRLGKVKSVKQYLGENEDRKPWSAIHSCPQILRYQFTDEFHMHLSDMCCVKMKEEPLIKWQTEHDRPYSIIGIMKSEHGRRENAKCLFVVGDKLKSFSPLVPMSKEWEEWFIKKYDIEICDIYKEPYNFTRTGCKGCPFAVKLQRELDILEQFFPNERKQCELIWKPVYDEYRRLGYRLKKQDGTNLQMSIFSSDSHNRT